MKAISIFIWTTMLFLVVALTGCEGEKELIIIEGNLPIKTSTLYMVGDATPTGWDIGNPTAFMSTEEDPLIFVYEGPLHTGELKCCLAAGNWDAPFIHPMMQGKEIGKAGIDAEAFQMYSGGDDLKWKVTEAGKYNLTFDLRNWTMSATYLGD